MFKISGDIMNQAKRIYEKHRLNIAASNVYFQNIRMLNGRHKIIDRETYKEFFHNLTADIELETSPIDAFVPCMDDDSPDLFVVNQLVPEYERIKKRITIEDIENTFAPSHPIRMELSSDKSKLSTIIDDIFIYYCVFKYLSQIDMIALDTGSNFSPIIEWVVENITLGDINNYMYTKKINEDKYVKYAEDVIFNPDLSRLQKFYAEGHDDIPPIDVQKLMMGLVSNVDLKSDMYIVIAIYMTLWFAVADISNDKIEDSPCRNYVRDVISKI